MSILDNFKPIIPTGNTNNFGNFISTFSSFWITFPLVLPFFSVIISSVCLYFLTKHYLNLQFAQNNEKILKNTEINQHLNSIFMSFWKPKMVILRFWIWRSKVV